MILNGAAREVFRPNDERGLDTDRRRRQCLTLTSPHCAVRLASSL